MFLMEEKLRISLFLLVCHTWSCDTVPNDGQLEGQEWTGHMLHDRRSQDPSLDCTFEEGICSWRHASFVNELKWRISQTDSDHTTGAGYYLRLRNDRVANTLIARLQSPPVVTSNQTCLSFWYFMKNRDVGELTVFRIGSGHKKHRLFRIYGGQGNRWYRALVPTGSGKFKLEITGTVGNRQPLGGILLDDISFSYESCSENELENVKDQPRVACDFEDDLCSWYNNGYTSRAEWIHVLAQADTKDRQPVPPFSDGIGMARLIRLKNHYNVMAQLQGPTISVDHHEACFSFWYKIEGKMVSKLEVLLYEHRESSDRVTVYQSGEQTRPTWIQANVTLSRQENFYIVLAALTHADRNGSVFIDDIIISYGGPCPKENQEDLINCDFDKDLCRWYMTTPKNENDWARIKGPTPTNSTGPSNDHTTGDGYYVFLDASKVEQANLFSQDIAVDSKGACVSFWYHMHGEDVYKLELNVQADPYSTSHIWILEESQENKWIQENVSLSQFNNERGRLVFTAQSAYFPRGDIALDDISITFGALCESDSPDPIYGDPDEYDKPTSTAVSVSATYTSTPTLTEITELPKPNLIVKDELTTVYENSRVELECQADTNLTVMTTWYRRKGGSTTVASREVNSKFLVFDEIQPRDGGKFTCTISFNQDVQSEPSNLVKINVVSDPRRKPALHANTFLSPDDPLEVDMNVRLMCGSLDVKGAKYHWKSTSLVFTDSTLPNSRILILNETKVEHSGVYSCRISKDGFMTAKSEELEISVVPGKSCDYNWECRGDEYKPKCGRKRCKCHKNAVPFGPRCLFKPEQPKIITFPRFLEYGIGESFYIICRAKDPAPPTMSYTFTTPKGQIESHGIMKISHATEQDTGYYACFVTYKNVTSEHSNSVIVQIKEFKNLTCDFHNDLCKWSQRNDSGLASFEHTTDKELTPDLKHPGAFIQVAKSDSDVPNKAVLRSPTIDRTTLDSCLTFQYRMLGSDIRGLTVWMFKFAERLHGDGGTRLWTAIGEKGRRWMERNVTVPPGEDFYIAFEAIGTVAITDIKFVYRKGC